MQRATDLLIVLLLVAAGTLAVRGARPPPTLGPPEPAPACEVALEVASAGVGCLAAGLAARAAVTGGDRVSVDARGRLVRSRMAPARLAAWRAPVDLNRASLEELVSLDGIGPKLAARIASARPFHAVAELARVPGIGPKKFALLRERLALSPGWR